MDWPQVAEMLRENPAAQAAVVALGVKLIMSVVRIWWRGSPEESVKLRQALMVGLLALLNSGVTSLLTSTVEDPVRWGNVALVGLLAWMGAMGLHSGGKRMAELPKALRVEGVL